MVGGKDLKKDLERTSPNWAEVDIFKQKQAAVLLYVNIYVKLHNESMFELPERV